jgi:hypothetical protein
LNGWSGCQSTSLAALRDALLPKLLSGEMRIKQAENMIEYIASGSG